MYTHRIIFDKQFITGTLSGLTVPDPGYPIITDEHSVQRWIDELENHEVLSVEGSRVRLVNVRVVPYN